MQMSFTPINYDEMDEEQLKEEENEDAIGAYTFSWL